VSEDERDLLEEQRRVYLLDASGRRALTAKNKSAKPPKSAKNKSAKPPNNTKNKRTKQPTKRKNKTTKTRLPRRLLLRSKKKQMYVYPFDIGRKDTHRFATPLFH